MNVGLFAADPAPYRLAAYRAPEVVLRALAPYRPDLEGVDALIVDEPGAALYQLARGALARGIHVFARARGPLTVRQLIVLREAAGRRGLHLRLAAPWADSTPLKAFRRALHQPTSRPWCLRLVRRLPAAASVADASFEELAFIAHALDVPPATVACQQTADVSPAARFLTLTAPGLIAHATVTRLEFGPEREIVAATDGRTLRFTASSEGVHALTVTGQDHQAEGRRSLRRSDVTEPELPALVAEAEAFLTSLAHPASARPADLRALATWGRAALLWEAANASLEEGGAPAGAPERALLTNTNPPPLRLIQGGGGGESPARSPRTLTLVR